MVSEIKERPMLFKGDMVRGIMREIDPKTQTRRIVDPQPENVGDGVWLTNWQLPWIDGTLRTDEPEVMYCCRHGKPGDRIWVKETFGVIGTPHGNLRTGEGCKVFYRATEPEQEINIEKWRPSIFMSKWASRITLEILKTRIERVQEISINDAIAEGIEPIEFKGKRFWKNYLYLGGRTVGDNTIAFESPIDSYRSLWDFINAKPTPIYNSEKEIVSYISFPWEEIRETRIHRGKPWLIVGNPHVWVIQFERVK